MMSVTSKIVCSMTRGPEFVGSIFMREDRLVLDQNLSNVAGFFSVKIAKDAAF